VHYELYDGLPTITKWIDVQNIATADQPPRSTTASSMELPAEPMLAQLTVERVHVPWHLRQRYHCETDFMPQIGVRNSFEDAGWCDMPLCVAVEVANHTLTGSLNCLDDSGILPAGTTLQTLRG
jgi:hypothetical protein